MAVLFNLHLVFYAGKQLSKYLYKQAKSSRTSIVGSLRW